MNSYFWINLVNKDTKEEICLVDLCESEIPARELNDNVCFAYNEYTLLTKDFFQKMCDCYKNKIKKREEIIKKSKEEQKKLVETIEAVRISDDIIYNLYDNSETIYWCEKEMATYKEFLSDLERVWEIFELNEDHKNKKHYELWYYYY